MMKIDQYVLSAMCNYPDASVHGITKLKPYHFTGVYKDAYNLIKTLYRNEKEIDYHIFITQMSAYGMSESDAGLLYRYVDNHTDDWKPIFEKFSTHKVYDKMMGDIRDLDQMRSTKDPISKISSKASKFASEWVTQNEKRYYSGQEVDESKEEYGEPILTGIPDYDDRIYKHGGNLRGQMKGVICREKHGKTRSECWEVAQNIRMGYKVLYITTEGIKKDIAGNVKQVLRHEWKEYRNNLFIVDGIVDIDEIESVILEAVLVEGVSKVVLDYIQNTESSERYTGENELYNNNTKRLRNLMVRHNYHQVILSQSRKESQYKSVAKDVDGNPLLPTGWSGLPTVGDAYGSNEMIKAASLIMTGFRPNLVPENVKINPLGSRKVLNPKGQEDSYFSFYLQPIRMRYKPEYLHKFIHFIDSDEGLKIQGLL